MLRSVFTLASLAVAAGVLLRESPMLMTHDSATGFMGVNDVRRSFAMTQTVPLIDQLNCGARALDLRLAQTAYNVMGFMGTRRRKINYHHGKVPAWIADQTLDNTVGELVQWAREHPDELVLLLTSHTYHTDSVGVLAGDGHMTHDAALMKTIKANFVKFGVKWEFDCSRLNTMSLEDAKQEALMSGGGRMLVVNEDCMADMYDSSINKQSQVEAYVKKTMSEGRALSTMFTVQSLIQQTSTVPLSADLNKDVLGWVSEGVYEGVSLLEVNTVCAYGPDIAIKLGGNVSAADLSTCQAACTAGCKKYSGLPGCEFKTELALPLVHAEGRDGVIV